MLDAEAAPIIAGRGRDLVIRILSPAEAVGEHEVYDLAFGEAGELVSDPHSPGCRESLTVIAGHMRVVSGDEEIRLGPGDTARYPADRPHEIAAETDARAILIVQDS